MITEAHLATAVFEVDSEVVLSYVLTNDSIYYRDLDIVSIYLFILVHIKKLIKLEY